jgi:diguanylate cyclase (GGDEF)-like protein
MFPAIHPGQYQKMKPKLTTAHSPSEPDPALLALLGKVKQICIAFAVLFASISFCAWLFPAVGPFLHLGAHWASPDGSLCSLFCALSLYVSEKPATQLDRISAFLGAFFPIAIALLVLAQWGLHVSSGTDAAQPGLLVMSPQAASGFLLMGFAALLIQSRTPLAAHAGEVVVFALSFLVLVFFSGEAFRVLDRTRSISGNWISLANLTCLALLTVVVLLRQVQKSVFSIFLGSGIGGRIARLASPILLIIPFVRETMRIRLIGEARVPANYITAILASVAAMVSFALLLLIVWRINAMELEIRQLSLLDELTGLYNLRGFRLLAEHALRMARRGQAPISVLFIDLDDLKQINDSYGHGIGSRALEQTGELLKKTFRESDIVGRIGGDEFAVAGQFSHAAVTVAAQRLREAASHLSLGNGASPLNLSVGHVTTEANAHQSLDELLALADKAMYEEKRRKKSIPA